jgi:hypothetical protein
VADVYPIDIVTASGQTRTLDEQRLARIQVGQTGFVGMGYLPVIGGGLAVHLPVRDDFRKIPALLDPASGVSAPIAWGNPPDVATDDVGAFYSKASAYVDILLTQKALGGQSPVGVFALLFYFIEFCQGTWSASPNMLEQNYVKNGFMSEVELANLHIWWVAVQMAVDMAGWYPWSLLNNPDDLKVLFTPPGMEKPGAVVSSMCGFAHSTPLFATKFADGFVIADKAGSGLPLLHPPAAALFSWNEVCQGKPPASQMDAANKLVEWFHGPANRHAVFEPLVSAYRHESYWAWKVGGYNKTSLGLPGASVVPPNGHTWQDETLDVFDMGLQPPPFDFHVCRFGGHQAFVGRTRTANCYRYGGALKALARDDTLWKWYADQIAVDVPSGVGAAKGFDHDTFGFLMRRKAGEAVHAAQFFVASSIGMNVPALFGLNWVGDAWSHALWLPTLKRALPVAEALWGPGAALFPTDDLWDPGFDTLKPGVFRADFEKQVGVVTSEQLSQKKAKADRASLHALYRMGRKYFESMLKARTKVSYEQEVLDAIVFKSHAFPPIAGKGVAAFQALRHWASAGYMLNPHRGVPLPAGEDQAEEEIPIVQKGWGSNPALYPRSVWAEKNVQEEVAKCWQWYNLGNHGYAMLTLSDP